MTRTQVYFPDEELSALSDAASKLGRSVSDLVREAVREVWLQPEPKGPVAIWDGESRRSSVEHDTIYDEP